MSMSTEVASGHFGGNNMNSVTIDFPPEVLWALQQEPDEFEAEARILLAVKLYEMGKLSTGLAARLAGVPRTIFVFLPSRYSLSPFGEEADELEDDLANARSAGYRQSYAS
jgi:predicted HTH domain antitoxin